MKNIIQKIKELFQPVEPNFVEYLCQKMFLDRDYHAKMRAVVRQIHKNRRMTMEDYHQFIEMGINFSEGKGLQVFTGRYSYNKAIYRLVKLSDNKYTKEDIEKSCGVGLEGDELRKFEYSLTFSKK